jgi:hypothetical protein
MQRMVTVPRARGNPPKMKSMNGLISAMFVVRL